MVIAHAGRRIDPVDASAVRFPPENVPRVEQQLRALFVETHATALVSSAACGADLLALCVAGELNLRRRVVLPFDAPRFRERSVIDRPGDWGAMFDRIVNETRAAGDLVIINAGTDDAAYATANEVILDEAEKLATQLAVPAAAVIVWNRRSRGPDDLTAHFGELATRRGLRVFEISTM